MINIYICEDNEEQREKVYKIIENIILIEDYDMEIVEVTDSPDKIINSIQNKQGIGIYFLDVDLGHNMNGIKLAEKIREIDSCGSIIFITTHAEMSYLTFKYKVEAMDYIIKDNYKNIRERIAEALEYSNKKYSKNISTENIFSIKVNNRIINLNHKEIIYFETSTTIHRIVAHCKDRQVEFYGKMKELEKELQNSGFCRCHTSYLVNKKEIKEINKKRRVIILSNGDECLISVRGMRTVIKNMQ